MYTEGLPFALKIAAGSRFKTAIKPYMGEEGGGGGKERGGEGGEGRRGGRECRRGWEGESVWNKRQWGFVNDLIVFSR